MSLLIDALRKAEASRLQASEGGESPLPEVQQALSLEPIDLDAADLPPAAARSTGQTRTPERIEPRIQTNRAPAAAASPEAPSAAARRVMEAQTRSGISPFLLAFVVLAVIALAAGSAYVWWQTQPRALQAEPVAASAPPLPAVEPNRPALAELPAEPAAEATTEPAPRSAPVRERRSTGATPPPAAEPEPSAEAVEIRRGAVRALNPAASRLEAGYGEYERGNLIEARGLYLEALRIDPRSIDALNGLAAVAMRSGQMEDAERLFRRALALDAQDPTALAGLSSLGTDTGIEAESRLKRVLAERPDSVAALAALGTLQARAGRWSDAQQTWFRLVTVDPGNPDALFNLAVALERIGQPRIAREHYERALDAAGRRDASFDRNIARARVNALTQP